MVAIGASRSTERFSTCSSWTRPRLTRRNSSALWQDSGSKRQASSELERKPWFKEASNDIRLLYSSLFWNLNKRPNPISRLVLSLFLLLPPVFSRLDVLSWLFRRLDAKSNLSRSKCFPLIRLDLALHIVPRIRYLGFTLREEGSLDYDGGLVLLQVQTNFDTTISPRGSHKQLFSSSCFVVWEM
jgi:hypothetical protein